MEDELAKPLLVRTPSTSCNSQSSDWMEAKGSASSSRGDSGARSPKAELSEEDLLMWHDRLASNVVSRDNGRGLVVRMIDSLGFEAVNRPLFPQGLTLFLQLVKDRRMGPVEGILMIATEKHIPVRIMSMPKKGEPVQNALQLSISARSPELVKLIITYATRGACDSCEVADMFANSLCRLLEKQEIGNSLRFGHTSLSFRTVFAEAMTDHGFLIHHGELLVPHSVFEQTKDPLVVGLYDQAGPRDGQSLWEMWREINPKIRSFTGDEYSHAIKVNAESYFIPFSNVAEPGSTGILEPITFLGCQDRVFKSLPIVSVIKWKWEKYVFRMAYIQMIKCIGLLLLFTCYSMMLLKCKSIHNEGTCPPILDIMCISSSAFSWLLLWGEAVQLNVYLRDGNTFRHKYFCALSRSAGIHYWLFTKWNSIEVVSFLLVGLVAPILHFIDPENNPAWHSWLIGGTSILLWWKLLYYLQLFEKTSPLVIMIFDVLRDMMAFLLISTFLLIGFGFGFIVLFQHEQSEIGDDFSSLSRACLTLFAYLLGAFELDQFDDTEYPRLAFGLFVVYEVLMTLVLLNLLIAIMGDSFDRIKEREATTFLMAKAAIIEDMECIYVNKLRKMKIPKYMHVLIPVQRDQIGGDSWWAPHNEEVWQGRMVHLERKIRTMMVESNQNMQRNLREASGSLGIRIDALAASIQASSSGDCL